MPCVEEGISLHIEVFVCCLFPCDLSVRIWKQLACWFLAETIVHVAALPHTAVFLWQTTEQMNACMVLLHPSFLPLFAEIQWIVKFEFVCGVFFLCGLSC